MTEPAEIDWAPFDAFPENTCECECGATYRSHTKVAMLPNARIVARKPCPSCGKRDGNIRSVHSDWEAF